MANRKEKIAYSVARDIVNEIATRRIPTGTVLEHEAEMMQKYDVSRGSLREAMRILEVLGFLHIKPGPGGGPVVTATDDHDRRFAEIASLYYQLAGVTYMELLEAREVMEPMAVRLATERRDNELVERLETFLEESRGVDLTQDVNFRTVGQDLHGMLARSSGNKIVDLLVRSCYEVFAGGVTGFLYPTEMRTMVTDMHEKIARAVIDGDANLAESLMREHMVDYRMQAEDRYTGLLREVVRW